MKIDCHAHLIGASTESGAYLSSRMRRSFSYHFILWKFGLRRVKDPARRERIYIEKIARWTRESELDRAVLLAFDEVYRKDGTVDRSITHTYVPNDFVSRVCLEHPELFFFGASVHPYRKDALEELERVSALGAVLVKLLPNSQGFAPDDRRLTQYYRKAAELNLPLLIHAGYEHTIPVIDQSFGFPERLRTALDEGATVIVAHAGTAGLAHPRETMGAFLGLLAEYPNCFGDISALTNLWRSKYLKLLLDPERLYRKYKVELEDPMSRMIHGSDFPIPVTPMAFQTRLAAADRHLVRKTKNPLQQDILIKRLLGVPEACLVRAHDELGIGRR
ncbi:MAG: amidohydrolase family protein [Deltaproteobacteria bacterium]|nr:amidohydrolase family protein [Deltaproteobacteria bacterium]